MCVEFDRILSSAPATLVLFQISYNFENKMGIHSEEQVAVYTFLCLYGQNFPLSFHS